MTCIYLGIAMLIYIVLCVAFKPQCARERIRYIIIAMLWMIIIMVALIFFAGITLAYLLTDENNW